MLVGNAAMDEGAEEGRPGIELGVRNPLLDVGERNPLEVGVKVVAEGRVKVDAEGEPNENPLEEEKTDLVGEVT